MYIRFHAPWLVSAHAHGSWCVQALRVHTSHHAGRTRSLVSAHAHGSWCVQALRVHTTQPVGCVRVLGEAKVAQHGTHGSLREGNARGAQQAYPYARLRWLVAECQGAWGCMPAANGQGGVPSIWGASEICEHARACIGSKATAHICALIESPFWLMPKGRDADLGARPPCDV